MRQMVGITREVNAPRLREAARKKISQLGSRNHLRGRRNLGPRWGGTARAQYLVPWSQNARDFQSFREGVGVNKLNCLVSHPAVGLANDESVNFWKSRGEATESGEGSGVDAETVPRLCPKWFVQTKPVEEPARGPAPYEESSLVHICALPNEPA